MVRNIEMTERDFLMYVFDPVKFQTFQRAARHAKAAKYAASNNNNISNVDAAAMLDGVRHVGVRHVGVGHVGRGPPCWTIVSG